MSVVPRVPLERLREDPGSGAWYVRVSNRGRLKAKKIGTHGQALRYAAKWKQDISEGRFFPKTQVWDPIFATWKDYKPGGFVADFLARNGSTFVDRAGAERLARYLAHAPEFKGKTMRELRRADAERYRERRRKEPPPGARRQRRGGGSPTTINRELSFARSVFSDYVAQLEDRGQDPVLNPFAERGRRRRKLYAPEAPGRTRHLGSQGDDEAERLFGALPDAGARAKVAAAILSGIDLTPMFAWTWAEDIDFVNGQVRSWRRKGDGTLRVYWVPMNDDLGALLRAVYNGQVARWGRPSKWVWPNASNTDHENGREFVRTVFKPALVKAGIVKVVETTESKQVRCNLWRGTKHVPGFRTVEKKLRRIEGSFRWKDLRHTCASWMIRRGVQLPVIGALLGHRPGSRQTNVYAHLTPDMKHEAVGTLTGLLPLATTIPMTIPVAPNAPSTPTEQ